MREKLELNTSIFELIKTMSEGNPGAMRVLMELLKTNDSIILLLHLDDMNIRADQIWIGYKDYCGEDLDKFVTAIKARDPKMIETINKECVYGDRKETAVTGQASFKR